MGQNQHGFEMFLRPSFSKAVPGTKPVSNVQFVTVNWTQELLVMVLIIMSIVQAKLYLPSNINIKHIH